MTDELKEELLSIIDETANFLRGMSMDPAIPKHAKEAILVRITTLDAIVEQHCHD